MQEVNEQLTQNEIDSFNDNTVNDEQADDETTESNNETVESQSKLPQALADLENQAISFLGLVTNLRDLQVSDTFKFLSKEAKNKKLVSLIDQIKLLEEISKVAYRNLKKTKRVNPPDGLVDKLIDEQAEALRFYDLHDDYNQDNEKSDTTA